MSTDAKTKNALEALTELTGFQIEILDNAIVYKAKKDDLLKKLLAASGLDKQGIEWTVDREYVIIKVPFEMLKDQLQI